MAHDELDRAKRFSQIHEQTLQRVGQAELSPAEIRGLHRTLVGRMRIGLGIDHPNPSVGEGLNISRTGVGPVNDRRWSQIPQGTQAIVAKIGGTNWDFSIGTKMPDGTLSLPDNPYAPFTFQGEDRHVAPEEFIGRIVRPTLDLMQAPQYNKPDIVALSLGFNNDLQEQGRDARLIAYTQYGDLEKGWRLRGWEPQKRAIFVAQEIRKRLLESGVDPKTIFIFPDICSLASDDDVRRIPEAQGLWIPPIGIVGGSGVEISFEYNGELVHPNIGKVRRDDEVSKKLRKNRWVRGEADLEQEIGGDFLVDRVAATIQLVGDQLGIRDSESIAAELHKSKQDQELLTKLATSDVKDIPGGAPVQQLARITLSRTGQHLGIIVATTLEARYGNDYQRPVGIRSEGGLFTSPIVPSCVETTGLSLAHPFILLKGSELKGLARQAMVR